MHSRTPETVLSRPNDIARSRGPRRILAAVVSLALAASGLLLAPVSAAAVVTPGQPVIIDGFDGNRHGTRSVSTLPAPGTSTTAPGTFSESNGAAFITAGGNGNAAAGVRLAYSFPSSDLTAGGNNTQLFFEFDDIARTPVQMLGETAMSVTASITDANGVTGTYNTGISNTGAFNIVLNFRCVDGPPCFSPQPDFTRVTALAVNIMYPSNYDSVASLATTLKVIRATPTGGAAPAAPAPAISTATTNILAAGTPSVDYLIGFYADGRQLTPSGFDAGDITLAGSTATGATVSGFVQEGSNYRVTVGPLTSTGTVNLGVVGGVYLDGWGQPSLAGAAPVVNFTQAVPPVITTLPDAAFHVGTAASTSAAATGVPAPALSATGLPQGLSMSATGVISGTPAARTGGIHRATVTATNIAGADSEPLTVTVTEAATMSAPSGAMFTIGSDDSVALLLGGYPAPTVELTDGELPDGLSLSAAGVLSGTPIGGAGLHTVVVTATNAHGTVSAPLSFMVTLAPTITSADTLTLRVGEAASFAATAAGYPVPTFSVVGTLPSGLALSSAGVLSGSPAAGTGGEHSVRIRAENGVGSTEQVIALVIDEAPTVAAVPTVDAREGVALAPVTVTAAGHPVPSLALESGSTLPDGLVFTDFGDGTATITGTPLAGTGGVHDVVVVATSPDSSLGSHTASVEIVVGAAPQIAAPGAQTWRLGTPVDLQLVASGHPAPAFTAGAIVPGVTIDATGRITGTPTTLGSSGANVHATNIWGASSESFAVSVTDAPAFTSTSAASFAVGEQGSASISTNGFPAPTISVSGALPTGVTLMDAGDGTATLSGTPEPGTGGSYEFDLVATNTFGSSTQGFTLTVSESPAIDAPTSGPLRLTVDESGSLSLAGGGFPAPVFTVVSGDLPDGVTLAADGRLLGAPSPGAGGVYLVTVSASNGSGTQSLQVELVVNEDASFTSPIADAVTAGAPVSIAITTFGYPAPLLEIVGGALPEGLTLVDNGDGTATISGIPKRGSGGVYSVLLGATQAQPVALTGTSFAALAGAGTLANTATQHAFTLTVEEAAAVDPAPRQRATVGAAVSFDVATIGFPRPAITVTGLPDGLRFADNGDGTGTVSGTPTSAGSFTLRVAAANGLGSADGTIALAIAAAPAAPAAPDSGVAGGAGSAAPLQVTGPDATPLALAGLSLLMLGMLALGVARRRRAEPLVP